MKVQVVIFSRPIMVYDEGYETVCGFYIPGNEKPTIEDIDHYVGYLCLVHCIGSGDFKGEKKFRKQSKEGLLPLQKKCMKKLGIEYQYFIRDVDESEFLKNVIDKDNYMIVNQDFVVDIINEQVRKILLRY